MKTTWFSNKVILGIGIVVAGICLLRVFSVNAHAYEDVEVYQSIEDSKNADDDTGDISDRAEVRLSRPGESDSRLADFGYEQVPGLEHLKKANDDVLVVPQKKGRAIASDSPGTAKLRKRIFSTRDFDPAESVEAPAPALPPGPVAPKNLTATVNEPRPLPVTVRSAVDQQAGRPAYGLGAEPKFEPKFDQPLPKGSALTGIQEVSIIVSDYGYFPSKIFVTQNIPVKLYLSTPSSGTLCFIVDVWGLRKGIAPGKVEEVVFIPEQAGEFRFYCPVKSIEGRIAVRESAISGRTVRGLASTEAVAQDDNVIPTKKKTPKRGNLNERKSATELHSVIEDE